VYSASSSAYGNTAALPKHESIRPDPRSPYAVTKLAGEHLMRAWALSYGIETVSLRYFNIFGPRQRHDSPYAAVIPMFAERLRRGERPVIYGDGRQSRDFTFVANAVHANLLAGGLSRQLLEAMGELLGVRAECDFEPARAGDVRDSEADIRLADELLGYRVIVPFMEGLRATIAK
jgi:UDP-glucose 4-epimerase